MVVIHLYDIRCVFFVRQNYLAFKALCSLIVANTYLIPWTSIVSKWNFGYFCFHRSDMREGDLEIDISPAWFFPNEQEKVFIAWEMLSFVQSFRTTFFATVNIAWLWYLLTLILMVGGGGRGWFAFLRGFLAECLKDINYVTQTCGFLLLAKA